MSSCRSADNSKNKEGNWKNGLRSFINGEGIEMIYTDDEIFDAS